VRNVEDSIRVVGTMGEGKGASVNELEVEGGRSKWWGRNVSVRVWRGSGKRAWCGSIENVVRDTRMNRWENIMMAVAYIGVKTWATHEYAFRGSSIHISSASPYHVAGVEIF